MSEAATASLVREGTVFAGRYDVVRCLSTGGMGAVYEVIHRDTKRRRALKVMLPSLLLDADMRERFAREAVVTADVDSEHIVETFDAGVDEATGCPFLVMELLKGEDLAHKLRREGPLDSAEVLVLLEQVALALDKTHDKSIVHRDLKPENLFLTTRDDGSPRIKILDFGIAKVIAHSQAAAGTRNLGSPMYMAPEQLDGGLRIGPGTDLYALAQIAFTLLVGRAYWEGEVDIQAAGMYALLLKIAQGALEPASTRAVPSADRLPPGFDAWFAKATSREPSGRFERASEQIAELAAILQPGSRAKPRDTSARAAPARTHVAEAVTADDSLRGARVPGNTTGVGSLEIAAPPRRASPRWLVPLGAVVAAGVAVIVAMRVTTTEEPAGTPGSAQVSEPSREPPQAAPPETAAVSAAPVPVVSAEPPPSASVATSVSASAASSAGKRPPPRTTGAATAAPPAPPPGTATPQEPWRVR